MTDENNTDRTEQTAHVVIAGGRYEQGWPEAVFSDRKAAEEYKEGLDAHWCDIVEAPYIAHSVDPYKNQRDE